MLRRMYQMFGVTQPWLGLVDAVGVGLAFLIWNATRDAGPRTRAIVSAAGAALLAYALAKSASGVFQYATDLGVRGVDGWAAQDVVAHLLVVAGVAVGVWAVLAVRRKAADAAEDLADDALVEPGEVDDEPDAYTTNRRRLVGFAPWADTLAVALVIGMPVLATGGLGGGFEPLRGRVSAAAIALHVLTGLLAAGALLVLVGRDDLADLRWAGAAFAVVAVGGAARIAWPEVLDEHYWSAFGAGLAAGLMAAAALGLLARAVPADRSALALGVVAAIALSALSVGMSGRVATEFSRQQIGEADFPEGFPTEFPAP